MFDPEFFPDSPGLYKITNPDGKVYIGQSTNVRRRLKGYMGRHCKDQPLLYNSFVKYGVTNHEFEVLILCSVSELNNQERAFIALYDSVNRKAGLNLTSGGQDYFTHCPEVRRRIGDAQRGNTRTLGRKQSKEEIAKRTAKTIGLKRTDDFRKRRRAAMLGKAFPESSKQKMRESLLGKNSKSVLNAVTGVQYRSAREAAEALGMKKTTLIAMLNGQNRNTTDLKYIQ